MQVKPLRKSASLIVLRELNGLLEYLMMTRKPNMSFANSCVFPGGVCEKEDQATENSSFVEYGKITAIRETLEEAGLLLLPQSTNFNELQIKSTDSSHEIVKRCWGGDKLKLLLPIIRLLTIHIPGKRYDCMFYIPGSGTRFINYRGYQQKGEQGLFDLNNLTTDNESVSYMWKPARQLLTLFTQGRIILAPPQIIILGCIKDYSSLGSLSKACIGIQELEPIMLELNTRLSKALLPYDKDYDISKFLEKEPETESKQDLIKSLERIRKLTEGKNVLCRFDMNQFSPHSPQSTFQRTTFLSLLQPPPKL